MDHLGAEASRRRPRALPRALGWASVGLGVPPLVASQVVARAAGVDAVPFARAVIRVTGVRELGHAAMLLAGPPRMVWTRLVGDAMDLTALGLALVDDRSRRRRVVLAATAIAAITVVDLYAASQYRDSQHGPGRPGPLRLRASTTIERPPGEVYARWRDFEHLPTFMRHIRSVVPRDDDLWHWEVRAPMGRSVGWDAVLTGDEPGRRISWLSVPGGDIDNSGTVHFEPTLGGRGTEVRVVLHYDVPGGPVGEAVAKAFGEEPERQVRDDVRRLKQVMETGSSGRAENQAR